MRAVAEIRLVALVALATWAGGALSPIAADWLTTLGVGEWTAVVLVVALDLLGLAGGLLYWWRTGKGQARREVPLLALAAPATVLGLSGLVTGSATPGHRFVLVFMTVPLLIFLAFAAARRRTARRSEATSSVTRTWYE